ncbi:MAG TPA: response regulator, partial [Steroidobacteraceae bacterium]
CRAIDASSIILRVTVTDNGIGIAEEALQRLHQAEISAARLYGGTGRGLSISKRLVELMNGRIGVSSREQTGSTFWFELPLTVCAPPEGRPAFSPILRMANEALAQSSPTLPPETREAPAATARTEIFRAPSPALVRIATENARENSPARSGSLMARTTTAEPPRPASPARLLNAVSPLALPRMKGTVLLVDDNSTNRMVLRSLLKKVADVKIIEAVDGVDAIAKWEASRADIDCILMDVHMPRLNGVAATARIRAIETEQRLARVPIIACTASVLPEERDECARCGMDGHLCKPLLAKELAKMLNTCVKSRCS